MSSPSPPSSPPSDSNPNSTVIPSPRPSTVVALAAPSALSAPSASAAKKPQPVLWNHEETLHLIEAYKEKWYSLKRGQLKAAHWEEIAVTVSARSGFDRSATQCRHKIEKMRKRFRAEKQRAGLTSFWPYYALMEELDRSPAPISARPLTRLPPSVNYKEEDDDNDDDEYDDADEGSMDNDDDDEEGRYSKSRSINYILRRPSTVNRFAGNAAAGNYGVGEDVYSGFAGMKKRKVEDEEEREGREKTSGLELAAEIRGFAERVMAMERRKMEMVRETERRRMEMENKRIQMIQNSQKKVVDLIARAFESLPDNLEVEQEA